MTANDETVTNQLTVFGADWCRDCRRSSAQLAELGVEYKYVDLEADPAAAAVAEQISGRKNIPVILFPDQTVQVEPSNAELLAKLTELGLVTEG